MPAMAAIVVKMNDGTTNITYDAVAASGGDNSPAVWRQDTGAPAGLPVGLRPYLKIGSKWNGPKTARIMNVEYVYPYATQDTTTTLYSSRDRVVVNGGNYTAPQGVPATVLNEASAQYSNLIASPLVKSILASGYSAT
jgi:hypothetical protein